MHFFSMIDSTPPKYLLEENTLIKSQPTCRFPLYSLTYTTVWWYLVNFQWQILQCRRSSRWCNDPKTLDWECENHHRQLQLSTLKKQSSCTNPGGRFANVKTHSWKEMVRTMAWPLKTGPFKSQSSKRWDFKCFQILKSQISDPPVVKFTLE